MLLSFESKCDLVRHLAEDKSETTYILAHQFQRLGLWTAIPLRPLTFLYGPNSAGKGSVLDCHRLIRNLCMRGESDALSDQLRRWRVSEDKALTVGLSGPPQFSDFYDSYSDDYWFTMEEIPDLFFSLGSKKAPQRITWLASWARDCDTAPSMEVFFGDKETARLAYHPDKSRFFINPASLQTTFDEPLQQIDFFSSLESFDTNHDGLVELTTSDFVAWRCLHQTPEFIDARLEDMQNFKALLVMLFASMPMMNRFIGGYVGPLRRVPNAEDLKWSYDAETADHERHDVGALDGDGLDCWQALADGIASRHSETLGLPVIARWRLGNTHLLENVNRWLSARQFFDTGYTLRADVRVSISADAVGSMAALAERVVAGEESPDLTVKLSLVDSYGRALAFSDAGTGFSQVIPVVISALAHRVAPVYYEQPELHLHPKLQTVLCDLFIEGVNEAPGKTTAIIESHSEHLLLRLLRRVAETAKADIRHRRFCIQPDEISVLYFEPADNVTYVHLLRVLSDGRFADRWPKGFFDERLEELSDE